MVCGMNSVGIASAGGAGRAVAEWMDQGYPTEDLWDVDIRRTFPWQRNVRYLHDRITEAVGNLYAHHYPYKQVKTSRNVRRSALHGHLTDRGACFGVVAGWERANWFAPKGVEPKVRVFLGPPELVRAFSRRAHGRARERGRLRPVLHGRVRGSGTGRRKGASEHLRQ